MAQGGRKDNRETESTFWLVPPLKLKYATVRADASNSVDMVDVGMLEKVKE
jgi:hypothetical protein